MNSSTSTPLQHRCNMPLARNDQKSAATGCSGCNLMRRWFNFSLVLFSICNATVPSTALYNSGVLSMWDSPSVVPPSAFPPASAALQLNWKPNQFHPQETKLPPQLVTIQQFDLGRTYICLNTFRCLTDNITSKYAF